MNLRSTRPRRRLIGATVAVAIALGTAACGGSDEPAALDEPARLDVEGLDVDGLLERIRAGDFVLPSLVPTDDAADTFVPMPAAEQTAILSGRRYLACTDWGITVGEDRRLTTSCNSWEFSADAPPIGRLDLRCTWCPESLPTGLDAPERPIFRPIDLDDPVRFWDNADNAIRLQALYDSVRAGRQLPNELSQWLQAVRSNRPATLTSAQRVTDDVLRAILAVF